jgi:hypothetical protein
MRQFLQLILTRPLGISRSLRTTVQYSTRFCGLFGAAERGVMKLGCRRGRWWNHVTDVSLVDPGLCAARMPRATCTVGPHVPIEGTADLGCCSLLLHSIDVGCSWNSSSDIDGRACKYSQPRSVGYSFTPFDAEQLARSSNAATAGRRARAADTTRGPDEQVKSCSQVAMQPHAGRSRAPPVYLPVYSTFCLK